MFLVSCQEEWFLFMSSLNPSQLTKFISELHINTASLLNDMTWETCEQSPKFIVGFFLLCIEIKFRNRDIKHLIGEIVGRISLQSGSSLKIAGLLFSECFFFFTGQINNYPCEQVSRIPTERKLSLQVKIISSLMLIGFSTRSSYFLAFSCMCRHNSQTQSSSLSRDQYAHRPYADVLLLIDPPTQCQEQNLTCTVQAVWQQLYCLQKSLLRNLDWSDYPAVAAGKAEFCFLWVETESRDVFPPQQEHQIWSRSGWS